MAVLGYDRLIALRDQLFKDCTYNLDCFQAASYELRAGNRELLIDGRYYSKFDGDVIELPPHQIAFLSTMEVIRLPHNIRGEIGLRLEYTSKGLVKLFGETVDPLYEGRLYLPVFNLTDRSIIIKPGDRVAIIIFHEVEYAQQNIHKLKEEMQRFRKTFSSIPHDAIEDWQGRHIIEIYKRVEEYSESIKNLQQQVNSVTATSQYVIWGGIFLIATTVLGAILQTIFGAWNSALNISLVAQRLMGPYSVIVLLLMPLVTVMLFMAFTILILRHISNLLR